MPKVLLNPYRNDLMFAGMSLRHDSWLDQPVLTTSDVKFKSIVCGDLTAHGVIKLTGTIVEAETETLVVRDAIITLNNENPATLVTGGFNIVRGIGKEDYEILYSESDKTLRAGLHNQLHPLALTGESNVHGDPVIYSGGLFKSSGRIENPVSYTSRVSFDSGINIGNESSISGDNYLSINSSNLVEFTTPKVSISDTLAFDTVLLKLIEPNVLKLGSDTRAALIFDMLRFTIW